MSLFHFILAIFISCFMAQSSHGKNLILMFPGEQKILLSPADEKLTLSQPHIVKIEEHENYVVLKARKIGELFLEQKNKTSVIKVLNRNKKSYWEKWIQQVEKIPWLNWNYSTLLNLYGSIYQFKDWKKISSLSQMYQIPYESYITVSSEVKKEAMNYFNQEHSHFKIKWNKPITALIPSFVPSDVFSSFGIRIQKEEQTNSPLRINVQLLVVEDRSNKMKMFKNQSTINIIETPFESLQLQLQSFQNKGESHTLFQTQILIENNKTGKIFFGGEVPFHTYQKETLEKNTQWKPYGLSLEIKPAVSLDQTIQLLLTADISDIDPSYSASDSFATKNHRIHTQITLKNDQTLMLSSLNRNQRGFSRQNPFQFSLPFLVSALAQKGEHKEKTKAFVFLNAKIQNLFKK